MVIDSITRREALVNARDFGLAAFCLEYILHGNLSFGQANKITIEEALQNPNMRESYINQLLGQLFGEEVHKYLKNVYYDHDRSKIGKLGIDTRVDAEVTTAIQKDRIGKREKSDLYVFSNIFETNYLKINNQTIKINPTEIRFKGRLEHEFLHAKDWFEEIKLEDGLVINGTHYFDISPIVLNFVLETRGWVREIEVCRKLENANPLDVFSLKFDKVPPAYLSAMHHFVVSYLKGVNELISPEKIPFGDSKYLLHQLKQIKARIPEIMSFDLVPELYKRFGIK